MSKVTGTVVCAVVALVCAVAAAAAPPAGTPDPRAVALSSADFPGSVSAGGASEGATSPNVASYQSKTAFPKPFGRSHYSLLVSTAFVVKDAASASLEYAGLAHELSTKSGQAAFVKSFLKGAKVKATDVKVTVAKAHSLSSGDASIETGFVFTLKKTKRSSNLSLSVVDLDRVVVFNVAAGVGSKVIAADAKRLAILAVGHAKPLLAPVSTAVPVVTGSPVQGQTLSASTGTWTNTTAGFAYQWQSCDTTGACTDLANATASSYVVQPTDVGRTLQVKVTASSRFGSAVATSAATAAAS